MKKMLTMIASIIVGIFTPTIWAQSNSSELLTLGVSSNKTFLLDKVINRVKNNPSMSKVQVSLTKAEIKILIYTKAVPKIREEFKGQLDVYVAAGTITQAQEDAILTYYDQVMAQWFTKTLSTAANPQYKIGARLSESTFNWSFFNPFKGSEKIITGTEKKYIDTVVSNPVENQGNIGSCTTFGGLRAYVYELVNKYGLEKFFQTSHLGLYYDERKAMGEKYIKEDSGCTIELTVKTLTDKGVGREELWPYETAKYTTAPSAEYAADALNRQVLKAEQVKGLQGVISALKAGHPVIIGVRCYDSFLSDKTAQTGDIPDPGFFKTVRGGHCICVVGFDDTTKRLTFVNSWGAEWGNQGLGTISYKYLSKYGSDFWIIYDMETPVIESKKTSCLDFEFLECIGWQVINIPAKRMVA